MFSLAEDMELSWNFIRLQRSVEADRVLCDNGWVIISMQEKGRRCILTHMLIK